MEEMMFDAGCRPMGRLFYWLVTVMMISGPGMMASGAAPVPQSGLATTTIADTVFLADGSKAQGNLIITWPAFLTARLERRWPAAQRPRHWERTAR
jgi:hypothetical protein